MMTNVLGSNVEQASNPYPPEVRLNNALLALETIAKMRSCSNGLHDAVAIARGALRVDREATK